MYVPRLTARRWENGGRYRRPLRRRLGTRARTDPPRPAAPSRPPLPARRERPLGHRLSVGAGGGRGCARPWATFVAAPAFSKEPLTASDARGEAGGYAPAGCRPPGPAPWPRSPRGRVSEAARWAEAARRRRGRPLPAPRPEVPGPGRPAAEEPPPLSRRPAPPQERGINPSLALPPPPPLRPFAGVRPARLPSAALLPTAGHAPRVRDSLLPSSCGPTGGGRGPGPGPGRNEGRGEEARHGGAALRAATPTCLLVVIAHHDEIVGQPGHG